MPRVAGLRVSAIVHATEEVDKVEAALTHLSSQEVALSKFERVRLKGHYGNEITTLVMSLRGVSAESFFHHLWNELPRTDQLQLIETLETRVDGDGRFFFRLDKQAAFLRTFRLTERDPLKVEVSFKNDHDSIQSPHVQLRRMLEAETS